MKILSLFLILLLSNQLFAENRAIVLDSVELTMPELLKEAEKQTGLILDLQVRESKAVKMFYDCTINLDNLLIAVKGYYKSQADLDLKIIKTEVGYWLGIETIKNVEAPKIENIKTEKVSVKAPVRKEPATPKKMAKTMDTTKEIVSKSKQKISRFFNRVKNKLTPNNKKNSFFKVKEDEKGNDLKDILKLNSEIDMKPPKEIKKKKEEEKIIKENFQLHPVKKSSYREPDIIDIELKKNSDHQKAKLKNSPASIENLDMDL
jgi:hypothetical protein